MKKDDLIQENISLRSRLDLALGWMKREVKTAKNTIQKKQVQSVTRKHFSNLFEQEGIDIIVRRIHSGFGDSIKNAPEYTLERLIDAEIYWQTLQKYPTVDGLPVILAYQKILDSWIEENLVEDFRIRHREERSDPGNNNGIFSSNWIASNHSQGLEKDIQNITLKKYTLSIGRLYQILSLVREGKNIDGLLSDLISFWRNNIPEVFDILVSDEFFLPFSELMDREIFTKKRHENKVTFADAKKVREVLIESNNLLRLIFSSNL
ncbi:hypothetical protein HOO68_00060 [Candidatus Gracilibacteria bacterium]|nr:hypothetical protein [Candidatus Gracilibacteria bacterium]